MYFVLVSFLSFQLEAGRKPNILFTPYIYYT